MRTAFEAEGEIRGTDLLAALVALWRESANGTLQFSRSGATAGFELAAGEIVGTSSSDPRFETAAILLRAGKLDEATLERLKAVEGTDRAQSALQAGVLTRREWRWGEKIRAVEILSDLLTWLDGEYWLFRTGAREAGEFRLSIPRLVLELFLRSRDRGLVLHYLGGVDVPLGRAGHFDAEFSTFGLTPDAESVVRLIDGKSTAAEITSEAPADAFAVEKLLAALVTLGLVHPEFAAADTTLRPGPLPVRSRTWKRTRKRRTERKRSRGRNRKRKMRSGSNRKYGEAQEEGEETLVARPGEADTGLARGRGDWQRSRERAPEPRPSPTPKRLRKRGAPPRVSGSRSSKSSEPRAPSTKPRRTRGPDLDEAELTPNRGCRPISWTWSPRLRGRSVVRPAARHVDGSRSRGASAPAFQRSVAVAARRSRRSGRGPAVLALARTRGARAGRSARYDEDPDGSGPRVHGCARSRRRRLGDGGVGATGPLAVSPTSRRPQPTAAPAAAPRGRQKWLDRAARDGRRADADRRARFTIQLELVCQEESLSDAWKHDRPSGTMWLLTTPFQDKTCFRVLWGRYPTREAAQRALAGRRPSFPRPATGPWSCRYADRPLSAI